VKPTDTGLWPIIHQTYEKGNDIHETCMILSNVNQHITYKHVNSLPLMSSEVINDGCSSTVAWINLDLASSTIVLANNLKGNINTNQS
jgi:hypothetical protein